VIAYHERFVVNSGLRSCQIPKTRLGVLPRISNPLKFLFGYPKDNAPFLCHLGLSPFHMLQISASMIS
jgi:hypothetical protein